MRRAEAVAALGLADAWIAAGAVRNAVWDHLHGFAEPTRLNDVDVIWFDPAGDAAADLALEAALRARDPATRWQVRNQARMHTRNADPPYRDCADAMRHWLETPTAIGARLVGFSSVMMGEGGARASDPTTSSPCAIALNAPFGVADLLALRVRPTDAGGRRPDAYRERIAAHEWLRLWPRLQVEYPDAGAQTARSA